MNQARSVFVVDPALRGFGPTPHLRLLVELEPGHRVFFRNLVDLVLLRRVAPAFVTSRPAHFWSDVFVTSATPWWSVAESMLCHLLLVVLLVWSQSRAWFPIQVFSPPDASKSITYDPRTQTFPAAESRPLRVPSAKPQRAQTRQVEEAPRPMRVTPERKSRVKSGVDTAPAINHAAANPPVLPAPRVAIPAVPFSALAAGGRRALSASTDVVAPSPQVDQATARRFGLPDASPIAPAPSFGGSSEKRRVSAAEGEGTAVIAPSPSVDESSNFAAARLGSGLKSLSGGGPGVIPPPPAIRGAATLGGRLNGLGGRKGVNGKSTATSEVVPPPSVLGEGETGGNGRALAGPLSGTGTQVVPPPSALDSAGSGRGSRLASLAGGGSGVVQPAPSGEIAGSSGAGRLGSLVAGSPSGSLLSGESQIIPPSPTIEGGGGRSGSGGRAGGMDIQAGSGGSSGLSPELSPELSSELAPGNGISGENKVGNDAVVRQAVNPPAVNDSSGNQPTVAELPLGLIGIVFEAPGSSYFSNFEVFVAKRRMGEQLQLIKIVYEFLPYQRRLSEYDFTNMSPRAIKLKVKPDPSCNESLGSMLQPQTSPAGPVPPRKLPEELRASDPNAVLACYRTNADDFLKAMSKAR
jgi:hypothetical protein